MAQFFVYRLPNGSFVPDLQTDVIETRARVIAPLIPERSDLPAITRLEPAFEIEGARRVLHTG